MLLLPRVERLPEVWHQVWQHQPDRGLPRHVAQAQSTADCRKHVVRRCKPKTTEQTDDISL
jgi:hypothetical protein